MSGDQPAGSARGNPLRRGGRSIRPFRPARVSVTEGRDGNAGSGSAGTARVGRGRPKAGSPKAPQPPAANHHENGSGGRNRFKTVVGRRKRDGQFFAHADTTLSPLCRARGSGPEHGALLYARDRADAFRHAAPAAPLGKDRHAWPDDGASLRTGRGRRRAVSRTTAREKVARISGEAGCGIGSRAMPDKDRYAGMRRSLGPGRRSIRRGGPIVQGKILPQLGGSPSRSAASVAMIAASSARACSSSASIWARSAGSQWLASRRSSSMWFSRAFVIVVISLLM